MPDEKINEEPIDEIESPDEPQLEKPNTKQTDHQLDDGVITEHDHQLEGEDAALYKDTVDEINNEPVNEQMEIKEMPVKTLADFFESMEERIAACEDQAEKQEMMFHLFKIKAASKIGHLKPEYINIGFDDDEDDIVVFDPANPRKGLKIDGRVLDNFYNDSSVFRRLFTVADAAKAGVKDKGMQELIAYRTGHFSLGEEARQTRLGFKNLDEYKAAKVYDWKRPSELADYFLQKELGLRLRKNPKVKYHDTAKYLKGVFKKAAPDLYKRLQQRDYGWYSKAKEIVAKLKEEK